MAISDFFIVPCLFPIQLEQYFKNLIRVFCNVKLLLGFHFMKSANGKRCIFKQTKLANTRLKTVKQIKLLHFVFMNTGRWCKPHGFLLSLFQNFICKIGFDGLHCSMCRSLFVYTSFIQELPEDGSENGYPGTVVLDVGLL